MAQMYAEIPLGNGMFAKVDVEDYSLVVGAGPWAYLNNGQGSHGDAVAKGLTRMHRLVVGAARGQWVDHRNGDRLDNRKANLRVVTPKGNAANRGASPNNTGYKGVSRHKNREVRPFEAKLRDGRSRYLFVGFYDTAEEAARAFDEAVRTYRNPEFERFNFPRPGERGLDGRVA